MHKSFEDYAKKDNFNTRQQHLQQKESPKFGIHRNSAMMFSAHTTEVIETVLIFR
jgi:hypothetical protein